jgi:hypothetical protein
LLKALLIWVTRSGQFGWRSAISLMLTCRPVIERARTVAIPSSSAKASPTSTKTGSKTI